MKNESKKIIGQEGEYVKVSFIDYNNQNIQGIPRVVNISTELGSLNKEDLIKKLQHDIITLINDEVE